MCTSRFPWFLVLGVAVAVTTVAAENGTVPAPSAAPTSTAETPGQPESAETRRTPLTLEQLNARAETVMGGIRQRTPKSGKGMTSKLGLLYLMGKAESAGMLHLADTGLVPIVKTSHHSTDRSHRVVEHNPRAIWIVAIGKEFHPDRDTPVETAERRVRETVEALELVPDEWEDRIDFIEVAPCMWEPGNVEQALWYSEYLIELIPRFERFAGRPIVLNSGVGGLPVRASVLDAMTPGLRVAHRAGGAWACHGYTLQYTTDPKHESWYSLRYRRAYDHFRAHAPELTTFPMILSEGGVDELGDPDKDGWQARGTLGKYTEWLAWYDAELKKDDQVLGVTLFKIGAPSIWKSFDLEPVVPWLEKHYRAAAGDG